MTHRIHHIYCSDCEIDYKIVQVEPTQNTDDVEPLICPFCGGKNLDFYDEEVEDGDIL
tara:strand:+ start:669 stop:842 length:174 start_codon:yes stop_codon:yes gene_type:complete